MSDQQRNLFDTEPAPWQEDDQAEQLVATVVLPTGPAQQFDYLVPDRLRDADRAGPPACACRWGGETGWSPATACGWRAGPPGRGG